MTCVERAAQVYQLEPCKRSFREDLEAHLLNGFVFSRPDLFVMCRPVVSTAAPALIVEPLHVFPSALCDCWHVFLFSGHLRKAFAFLPWELPFISFERANILKRYPLARLRDLSP